MRPLGRSFTILQSLRQSCPHSTPPIPSITVGTTRPSITSILLPTVRLFSTTQTNNSYLFPKNSDHRKGRSGQVKVQTGGSTRGTTVVFGHYGLRMIDAHRRISAAHLKLAEEAIHRRLKNAGGAFKIIPRVSASIPVHVKGNEVRMGGGRGSFDHWAARVKVSRILFEVKGSVHEMTVRDAFRLAGNKLPGRWEFAKKGDVPYIGTRALTPQYQQELIDSKMKLPRKLERLRQEQKSAKKVAIVVGGGGVGTPKANAASSVATAS